jgi:hypothetical protein
VKECRLQEKQARIHNRRYATLGLVTGNFIRLQEGGRGGYPPLRVLEADIKAEMDQDRMNIAMMQNKAQIDTMRAEQEQKVMIDRMRNSAMRAVFDPNMNPNERQQIITMLTGLAEATNARPVPPETIVSEEPIEVKGVNGMRERPYSREHTWAGLYSQHIHAGYAWVPYSASIDTIWCQTPQATTGIECDGPRLSGPLSGTGVQVSAQACGSRADTEAIWGILVSGLRRVACKLYDSYVQLSC